MREYDVVVIGAGAGGYEAAIKLAKAGLKTALIEKEKVKIGGVCLNEGCIPTKTYLESAQLLLHTQWYSELGIELEIKGFDLPKLQAKSEALKDEIRSGVVWLLDQAGVEIIYGEAQFQDKHTIVVDETTLTFKHCIIATGSIPRSDAMHPVDGEYILSSKEVFDLQSLPKSIVIMGGGAIGCEFATFFAAMGVEVTMLSRREYLVPSQDRDVSKALMRAFKKRGIKIISSAKVVSSKVENNQVKLELDNGSTLTSDKLLLAIGRVPNTQMLNLESTDVKLDSRGSIEVNESFQTTQPHIYAVGDCIATTAYAHVATKEAKVAAHNIIHHATQTKSSVIPSVIFSIPQIASCGINEAEAKDQGIEIEIKKHYYKANPKAKILGDDAGFSKYILDASSGKILGASIVGALASELIHIITMAMEQGMSYDEMQELVYAHPTLSEVVG